jgi:hypothetical protein
MATREQWLDSYEIVYDAIPGDPHVPCPNCGHDTLRLVFTGDPERMVGYAGFWCDNCLQGIGISRAPIPDGAIMQNIHDAPEDRQPKIPNYQLVA